LFYVRNTKDIIRFDIQNKTATLVGTTRDAVLAMYATTNKLRDVDTDDEEKKKSDNNQIALIDKEEIKEEEGIKRT